MNSTTDTTPPSDTRQTATAPGRVYVPQDAPDPLAWYIDKIERDIDHAGPYCIVTVFRCAGFDSIPIDLLEVYGAVEEAANTLRTITETFLKKLEAIAAARAGGAQA